MKRILLILLCLSCFSFTGCAPATFVPRAEVPELKWDKIESYSNQEDVDRIKEIGKVTFDPKYIDHNKKETTPIMATHVILTRSEYQGIGVIIEKAKAYKELSEQEEALVNIHISIINSQREYLALERQKSIEYQNLWVRSENSYRQEEYRHERDNFVNKVGHYIIVIGAIALGAASL